MYTCDNCDKVFTQKGHYDSHQKRKTPCKKDIAIEKMIERKVQEALSKIISVPIQEQQLEYTVKPFLKWVGGKTQIIDSVIKLFPKEMVNYHEPFLGGGSVLLALLTERKRGAIKVSGTVYASDLNSNLIGLYKNIQSDPDSLIKEVKSLVDTFSKSKETVVNRKPLTIEEALTSPESYYFWIRSRFNALSNEGRQSVQASAMLLFMNKTCFRGVYREGPNGFNVPFGNYKNPSIIDEENIRKVSLLIQGVVFIHTSFTHSIQKVEEGDFVYLDPPYAPNSDTSFVSYTSDGFSIDNHKALFAACEQMRLKSIKFLMSNADVSLVKEAFPSPIYTTQIVSCRRAIHSKEPGSKVNEVLIMN